MTDPTASEQRFSRAHGKNARAHEDVPAWCSTVMAAAAASDPAERRRLLTKANRERLDERRQARLRRGLAVPKTHAEIEAWLNRREGRRT